MKLPESYRADEKWGGETSPACCWCATPPLRPRHRPQPPRPSAPAPPSAARSGPPLRVASSPGPEPCRAGREPLQPPGDSSEGRGCGRRNPNHHQRAAGVRLPLPPLFRPLAPPGGRRLSPFTPPVFVNIFLCACSLCLPSLSRWRRKMAC